MNQDFKPFTPDALGISVNIYSTSVHGDPDLSGTVTPLHLEQPYPNEASVSGGNAVLPTDVTMPMPPTQAGGTQPETVHAKIKVVTHDSEDSPALHQSENPKRLVYDNTPLLLRVLDRGESSPAAVITDASNSASTAIPSSITPKREYHLDGSDGVIRRPNPEQLAHVRKHCGMLFTGQVHSDARGVLNLNLLNANDVLTNIHLFDPTTRYLLSEFFRSNWEDVNDLSTGMKTKDGAQTIPEALLLLITLGLHNIYPTGAKAILSNLQYEAGLYHSGHGSRRCWDPKAARKAQKDFLRRHAVELLFPKYKAYRVLFKSDPAIHRVNPDGGVDEARLVYGIQFHEVREKLLAWKAAKYIHAFLVGHEISCSIREHTFNPHSHAIIWMHHDQDPWFIDEAKENGDLISRLPDPVTTWSNLCCFVQYIMKAQSLVSRYKVEYLEQDLENFNQMTVRAFRTMSELGSVNICL